MRVQLAYGRHGTSVEVPEGAEVVAPLNEPGLQDEAASVTAALRRPLAGPPLQELAAGARRIAVVFSPLGQEAVSVVSMRPAKKKERDRYGG